MTAPELRAWIDSLTQDIDFAYRGKFGSICPFIVRILPCVMTAMRCMRTPWTRR